MFFLQVETRFTKRLDKTMEKARPGSAALRAQVSEDSLRRNGIGEQNSKTNPKIIM